MCEPSSNPFDGVLGAHSQRDSAACGELRRHDRFARGARFDEIVKDVVRDGFVECALVTVRREIEFQRLAFDAQPVRHVIDIDPGKIGLTGYRTNRSEIICFKMNAVIPVWSRIWERLQTRFGRRSWNFSVAVSE